MADAFFNGAQSDWLGITRNAFRDGRIYFDSGIRREIEQDVRQFQGLHPMGSKYLSEAYRSRSRFFRPKTRSTIRKNEAVAAAAFFSNVDVVEISPWDDSDKMQEGAAKLQKELLNLRLRRSIPWFQLSMAAYQEAQAVGLVCSHQYWKTDKKRGIDQPMIELVPIENMVFSPSAHWYDVVGTTPYLIRLIPMLVKDVQARMRTPDPKTGGMKWQPCTDNEILQSVHHYSDSIRLQREVGRPDPQAAPTSLTPFQLVWIYETIADINGEDYIWYTLGETKVLTNGVPLKKLYWHGLRPYVIGYSVIEAHKVYPPGVARIARDIQGELNENANQRLDNVKLAMNKRYFGKRGSQIDLRSLTRSISGAVTLMNDPEKDVKIVETQDVTGSAYREQDRLNADFDEMAGSFSQSSIQGNKELSDKVGGMEILTEDANLLQGYQLRTYTETWVEPTLYQLMRLEQHYETDEDVLMLAAKKAGLGEGGTPETVDDALLMQELNLTVHVGIGATTPKSQLENLIFAFAKIREMLADGVLAQYNLNVEEVINEIFGKLGYKSGERFFDWNDQNPMVQTLKMQVQQLQQELANKKDPPELTAAKVDMVRAQIKKILAETFNVNVEGLFGSMQAGEVVAAVPAVGPVADTIARAAGYEPPVPAGVDPGIADGTQGISPPSEATPPAGLSIAKNGVPDSLGTHNAGINLNPGGQPALPQGVPHNTDPLHPALPVHPALGANKGIEGGR